jgi:hypothetical protein
MTRFFPTHKAIDALYKPFGCDEINVHGNWDSVHYLFGVTRVFAVALIA